MPYDYRQVSDLYDTLKQSGATQQSMPEWADSMNRMSGSDLYSAGLHDNFVKRASVGIDRALDWTGLPDFTGELGRDVGGLFGEGDLGQQVGHGLIRGLVNLAPSAIPYVGPFLTAALAGSQGYTDTDSPGAGVISGIANAALPDVAEFGEQAALKGLGGRLLEGPIDEAGNSISKYFATNLGQSVGAFGGSQAAAAGLLGAADVGQNLAAGHGLENPFTKDFFVSLGLQTLPFTALHLGGKALGFHEGLDLDQLDAQIEKTKQVLQQRKATEEAKKAPPVTQIPPLDIPELSDEQKGLVNDNADLIAGIRNRTAALTKDLQPENVDEVNQLMQQEHELTRQQLDTPVPNTLFGEKITENSEGVKVLGEQHYSRPGYMIIKVADDTANREAGFEPGELVSFSNPDWWSGRHEQTPAGMLYEIPKRYMTRGIVDEVAEAKAARAAENPQLPQVNEVTVPPFDHVEMWNKVNSKLAEATTHDELRSAVVDANSILTAAGWPELTDAQIKREAGRLQVDEGTATKNVVRQSQKKLESTLAKRKETEAAHTWINTLQIEWEKPDADEAITSHGEGYLGDDGLREKVMSRKGGDQLVDSGELDRLFYQWDNQGRPGGMAAFEDKVDLLVNNVNKRGNVTKVIPLTVETAPVVESLQSNVGEVLAKTPGSQEQKKMFRYLFDNYGTDFSKVKLDEVADAYVREIDGNDEPSADDVLEIKELLHDVVESKLTKQWLSQIAAPKPNLAPPWLQYIVRTAVQTEDGQVHVSDDQTASHSDIIKLAAQKGVDATEATHGFIDSRGDFIGDRKQALDVAHNAKQVTDADVTEGLSRSDPGLHSDIFARGKANAPDLAPKDKLFKPQSPEDVAQIAKTGLSGSAVDALKGLLKDNVHGALAKDLLAKFPALLSRIKIVILADGADVGYARPLPENRTIIAFSPDILAGNDAYRNFKVIHEVIHGMTQHELDNPAKAGFVKELSDFRERLIQGLPKAEREQYQKAVADGWYDRYVKGEANPEELGHIGRFHVLYGLLNDHEFVAQGFSSLPMRKFLEGVKGERGNGWQTFKGWLGRLLGLGEKFRGTALDELMNHATTILTGGESVAEFHNYIENWFQQRGVSEEVARAQGLRAVGILTSENVGDLYNVLDLYNPLKTAELAKSERAVNNLLKDKDIVALSGAVMNELGLPLKDSKSIDMLARVSLEQQHPLLDDALKMLPDEIVQHYYNKLQDYKSVINSVKDAAETNLTNITDPGKISNLASAAIKQLDGLLKGQSAHQEANEIVEGLQATDPTGFGQVLFAPKQPTQVKTVADFIEKPTSKVWKGFRTFFQQTGQLAKTSPESAELISKGFQLKPLTGFWARQIIKPFALNVNNPEAGVSKEGVDKLKTVFKDPKVLAAINNWIYQNQAQGADSVSRLDIGHPDVAKKLAGLSPEQKTLVENVVLMHGGSIGIAHNFELNARAEISALNGVAVIKDSGLKATENLALTTSLFNALTAPPESQTAALAQIAEVSKRLTPEAMNGLLQFMKGEVETWRTMKDHFDKNPHWSTAQRYGNYLVEYWDGGKRVQAGVDSEAEADALTKGKDVISFKPNGPSTDDMAPSVGLDQKTYQRLADLQKSQVDIMRRAGLSNQQIKDRMIGDPVQQFITEQQAARGPGFTPGTARTRQLSKGADRLPWLENHFRWAQRTAGFWARQRYRAQNSAYLTDPTMVGNPELAQKMSTHADNMLSHDPQFGQQMNRFISTWMLGFRPSTAIITASHFIIRHTSELTRMTGKPVDSFRRVGRALKEIVETARTGKPQNEEHEWLMKEADKYGERDHGWFTDEESTSDQVALDFLSQVKGEKPQGVGQRLASAGNSYSRAAMWMFQHARRINEESALYASYDLHREQGLDRKAARDKAFEFNHATNPVGGRAQRPIGLFDNTLVPRTPAMMAYSLHSYVLGTIGQLGRYVMEGKPWADNEKLTPNEKWNARKAALQMVAMQTGAAGLLGLPFATGALALLNQFAPQLEVNKKVREGMDDLMGNNHELTDMALTGLPSMLGWDFHSRLSMGNVIPGVSELDGFQPQQLLGPPANLLLNFVNGTKQLAAGNLGGAADLMPTVVKDVINTSKAANTVHDYKGRPLFQPTPGEIFGTVLGFKSTRQSQADTEGRIAGQIEDVDNKREGQWRQQQAQAVTVGQFGAVRQALRERVAEDKNYDFRGAAEAIARATEELTFTRDLRRETSTPGREAFLNTFNVPTGNATETQRLLFRQQILQQLGLPRAASGQELKLAQVMDLLKSRQPMLSRQQIRSQALRLLHGEHNEPLPEE